MSATGPGTPPSPCFECCSDSGRRLSGKDGRGIPTRRPHPVTMRERPICCRPGPCSHETLGRTATSPQPLHLKKLKGTQEDYPPTPGQTWPPLRLSPLGFPLASTHATDDLRRDSMRQLGRVTAKSLTEPRYAGKRRRLLGSNGFSASAEPLVPSNGPSFGPCIEGQAHIVAAEGPPSATLPWPCVRLAVDLRWANQYG